MSCQSMKRRQSRTKEGEIQPAWFHEKFRPGCTAWLDPEGRDRGGSSRGSGSGKAESPLPPSPAQGKHFEQTPQLWPPPLISTSGKLQRDWGRKGRWLHGLIAPWSDTSAGLSLGSQTPLPYYSLGWMNSTVCAVAVHCAGRLLTAARCAYKAPAVWGWWGSEHDVDQLNPQHPYDCPAQQERKGAERSHTAF